MNPLLCTVLGQAEKLYPEMTLTDGAYMSSSVQCTAKTVIFWGR
jgi:hypothetical protein